MSVEDIQKRRDERKAANEAKRLEQFAIDLEALDCHECTLGDSNVARLDVPYTPGLPTMALARTPKPAELKRYRFRVQPKKPGDAANYAEGSEELAAVVLLYPDASVFAQMCEARPGLAAQLGAASLGLATAQDAAEGKG